MGITWENVECEIYLAGSLLHYDCSEFAFKRCVEQSYFIVVLTIQMEYALAVPYRGLWAWLIALHLDSAINH